MTAWHEPSVGLRRLFLLPECAQGVKPTAQLRPARLYVAGLACFVAVKKQPSTTIQQPGGRRLISSMHIHPGVLWCGDVYGCRWPVDCAFDHGSPYAAPLPHPSPHTYCKSAHCIGLHVPPGAPGLFGLPTHLEAADGLSAAQDGTRLSKSQKNGQRCAEGRFPHFRVHHAHYCTLHTAGQQREEQGSRDT